jgi:hypothetical protein
MDMQHGQGTCIMNMYMQHGRVNTAWTMDNATCIMIMYIQHGRGHAAWTYTWKYSVDIGVKLA